MSCPVCGSTNNSKIFEFIDSGLFSQNGKLALFRCDHCGLQFNLRARDISLEQMKSYYQGGISWEKRKSELLLSLPGYQSTYREYRNFVVSCLSKNHLPELRLLRGLDVGGGAGEFCFYAKRDGFDTELMDFSEQRLRFAREVLDIPQTHPQLPGKTYDIIWLLQVIEHVADPTAYLKEILRTCARPGTLLMLATPNTDSLGARVFGKNWKHYNPHHVTLFNPNSIKSLLSKCGLEVLGLDGRRMYGSGRATELKSLLGSTRRRNPKSLSTDGVCVLARLT